jgi:hypothetical protein
VRLGAVTGVGHARLINERFGRFRGWFSVGDLFISIVTELIGVSPAALLRCEPVDLGPDRRIAAAAGEAGAVVGMDQARHGHAGRLSGDLGHPAHRQGHPARHGLSRSSVSRVPAQ